MKQLFAKISELARCDWWHASHSVAYILWVDWMRRPKYELLDQRPIMDLCIRDWICVRSRVARIRLPAAAVLLETLHHRIVRRRTHWRDAHADDTADRAGAIMSAETIQRPVIYLDVDDTLLRFPPDRDRKWWEENRGGAPADGVGECLAWAREHCEVRWLTMWAMGGEMKSEPRGGVGAPSQDSR